MASRSQRNSSISGEDDMAVVGVGRPSEAGSLGSAWMQLWVKGQPFHLRLSGGIDTSAGNQTPEIGTQER